MGRIARVFMSKVTLSYVILKHTVLQGDIQIGRSQCRSTLARACYFALRHALLGIQGKDISPFFNLFPPADGHPKL